MGSPFGVPGDSYYPGTAGAAGSYVGATASDDAGAAATDDIQRPGPNGYGYIPEDCILSVIDDASNVGIAQFAATTGSGNVIDQPVGAWHAFIETRRIDSSPPYELYLHLKVGGLPLSLGTKYQIDPSGPNAYTQALFQIDESATQQWDAVPGGVVIVHGAQHLDPLAGTDYEGPNGYTMVSFWLKALEFQPSATVGNRATGHFKFSGYCSGAINDHYYAP